MSGQDDDNFDYAKHAAQLAHDNDKENTMADIDRKTLDKAREWAEHAKTLTEISVWPTARAAAEVIQSLPDQWIDADKVRKLLDKWEGCEITSDAYLLYRELEALLPAPKQHPEDVPVGEAWQLKVGEADCIGLRNGPSSTLQWLVVIANDRGVTYCDDEEVTLVARLAPDTGSRP